MFFPRKTDEFSRDELLQLLLDEREIRSVLYRWCRSIDRRDIELTKTCFHEDAIDHHAPYFEGNYSELIPYVAAGTALEDIVSMQYNLGNVLIEVDRDVARTESYGWSAKRLAARSSNGEPLIRLSGLRYLDRFERRNGDWKIAERWFVPEWDFYHEVPEMTRTIGPFVPPKEQKMKPILTKRDKSDMSYSI
jgi:hypothetical protein